MAGLALYGDLSAALEATGPISVAHRLESVKMIPNPGGHHDPELYGDVTRYCMARPESEHPTRQRVFCSGVASVDDRDRGRPSSWSAAIDAICSGMEDDEQRLMVLTAGNTDLDATGDYPNGNMTDGIHDPGQSWNAITVGVYTEKTDIDPGEFPDWELVAPHGDISPMSCTSVAWGKTSWPLKPDVVVEGGNMAKPPDANQPDYLDSLSVLSTGSRPQEKLFVAFGDTCAAAAQGGGLAAKVWATYPDFWPETVRALIVHSAKWTPAMRARFDPLTNVDAKRNLLRWCGYGVPDEAALLWSASNSLTLVAQSSLQPFVKVDGSVKTRDINFHAVPWPTETLQGLGEVEVRMRVTLSYFVEPSPGQRGWASKFKYQSHGLRFSVRRAYESDEQFRQRCNRQARDEEAGYSGTVAETGRWELGERLRALGSIHSDTWTGTAAELAARGAIAVFPVTGWWKERPNLERWGKQARYALVVTIETPEQDMDIYTPVFNEIATSIDV